ncbi:hypothetical protein Nepgr_006827 [Nepenthes gracilis]|uniref:Uncharacterized protein n=1 Tax=Nepenthes gracilis TaxID=150966 RepID=A0AAD3S5R2_NEPGR|nr:hypothetical protein Nepgr_006827 [Nepenthes gracilis]
MSVGLKTKTELTLHISKAKRPQLQLQPPSVATRRTHSLQHRVKGSGPTNIGSAHPPQASGHVNRAQTVMAPRHETGQHSTKYVKTAKKDTQLPHKPKWPSRPR